MKLPLVLALTLCALGCAGGDDSEFPAEREPSAGASGGGSAGTSGGSGQGGGGGQAGGGQAGAAAGQAGEAGEAGQGGSAAGQAGAGGAGAGGAAGGCKGVADCGDGEACVKGACAVVCESGGQSKACPEGEACSLQIEGDTPETSFKVCQATGDECQPGTQTGCTGSLACFPQTGGAKCLAPGDAAAGQACEYANDCVAGTTCLTIGGASVCRVLCDLATKQGCDAAASCTQVKDSTYGICSAG